MLRCPQIRALKNANLIRLEGTLVHDITSADQPLIRLGRDRKIDDLRDFFRRRSFIDAGGKIIRENLGKTKSQPTAQTGLRFDPAKPTAPSGTLNLV